MMDKKNIKRRLFVVSSPHNALASLAIIKQDDEIDKGYTYEDYAIIWDITFYDFGKSWKLAQATLKMLDIHNFICIDDLSGYEQELNYDFTQGNIDKCRKLVFNRLKINDIDELYVVRNNENNKIFTFLFENSKIIVYGETYHKIDSCIGGSFKKIDEFRVILPVDFTNGLLKAVPLRIVPKKYLLNVISDVLEHNAYDKAIILKLKEMFRNGKESHKSAILALQYLSDINKISESDEITLYIDAVSRSCSKDTIILIKEHPRTLSRAKAERVKKHLVEAGYINVYVFDRELHYYPIEVICHLYKPDQIISPLSTSLLIVKYLYGISGSMEMDDLLKYSEAKYQYTLHNVLKEAINNLEHWNPADNKPLAIYSGQPIFSLKFTSKKLNIYKLGDIVKYDPILYVTELFEKFMQSFSNDIIIDMFKQFNFESVALYGVGKIGKIIVDKLVDSDIKLYLIDSNTSGTYKGLNIYKLQDESLANIKIDAVVSTVTHSYNAIVHNILKSKLRKI